MPAVGDQHRRQSGAMSSSGALPNATTNPFDDTLRISEYTAQQIATLQTRLEKRLGPEYLSTRQGPGGLRVHYITADKCINLANEVFGFNGWSSSIQNIQVDFVDEDSNSGKVSLGLSVIVRVTLKDGTFHEDVGYGHTENCKGKAAAFEKAKKEGTTDALKRALRTFGNVLGNCIYDKEYLSRVTKVKAAPAKWEVDQLHRHPNFNPVKKEPIMTAPPAPIATGNMETKANPPSVIASAPTEVALAAEYEVEFGSDLFDEADFSEQHTLNPDEVVLDQQPSYPQNNDDQEALPLQQQNDRIARVPHHFETPSKPQRPAPAAVAQSVHLPTPADRVRQSIPQGNYASTAATTPIPKPPSLSKPPQAPPNNSARLIPSKPSYSTSNVPPPHTAGPAGVKSEPAAKSNNKNVNSPTKIPSPLSSQIIPEDKRPEDPAVGFYSARAAETLKANPYSAAKTAPVFNPQFESPSIRRTAGFNHNTSAPVARNTYQILPPQPSRSVQDSAVPPLGSPNNASAARTYAIPPPGAGFVVPTTRPPMTTSYRPPTRRSVATNNTTTNNTNTPAGPNATSMAAPNTAVTAAVHNANGKRPPLSDMTNTSPAPVDEKASPADSTKRTKMADGGAGGNAIAPGVGGAQRNQQISISRVSDPSKPPS